jgi:hypothetical protein
MASGVRKSFQQKARKDGSRANYPTPAKIGLERATRGYLISREEERCHTTKETQKNDV